ncbi:hypothetical protein SLEP1_g3813 [Rubroshorea leprosula]|uniref:Uncharacterized protein n=1 Tax=Rubroshorea leprosula TaxID=152421 RepID=A0AAV5HT49_9ROSI|nr:hypothetical protein SLEP1_g3813 [Rubroshorea leprosula]
MRRVGDEAAGSWRFGVAGVLHPDFRRRHRRKFTGHGQGIPALSEIIP